MPIISVIVPVYNTEKYLCRCFDSILKQSFTDFELIIIDDGSTDDSGKICDEYASADERVKVVHKPNQGIGATRQLGLELVTGMYISFVDSDDWVEPNMLEENYNLAKSTNADIVVFDYFKGSPDNYIVSTHSDYKSGEDLIRATIDHKVTTYVWDKLFSTHFLRANNISFTKGVNAYEDCLFCLNTFHAQPTIAHNHNPYYYYTVLREGALTNNFREMCIGQKNFLNFLLSNDSYNINLGEEYILKTLVNLLKYETINDTEISQILHHHKIKDFLRNVRGHFVKRLILWLACNNAFSLIHGVYRFKDGRSIFRHSQCG